MPSVSIKTYLTKQGRELSVCTPVIAEFIPLDPHNLYYYTILKKLKHKPNLPWLLQTDWKKQRQTPAGGIRL